jgi:fatty acid amide hydrolase 2
MQVAVVRSNGIRRVDPQLHRAQDRVANILRGRGASVREVEIPGLKKSIDVWSQRLSAAGGKPFREILEDGRPKRIYRELLRWALRRSDHTFPALALAKLETFPLLVPSDLGPMLEFGDALKEEVAAEIGSGGVLLFPPYTRPAPRHYMPMATPFDWAYTAIFNALENPVTQVPVGLSRRGLPLGVQVVGLHGEDHVTIAVAQAVEEELGGWVPPWQV